MNRRLFVKSGLMASVATVLSGLPLISTNAHNILGDEESKKLPFKKIVKTDAEWKRTLTAEQYQVARKAATEAPYSSPLVDLHKRGIFLCVCCDLPVFSSRAKFDSQTGWPSFFAPIKKINLREEVDNTTSETRTEVLCNRCDAHLGHVFDDGPKPTGLRYCMNGVAMKFVKNS